MRVLVTNDDGIASPGLAALASMVADAGMTPVVAAPALDHSGAAAALGPLADPSRVSVDEVMLGDLSAHSVHAPTALIVMLSMLGGFGDPPDLVLSGVNNGPNTGRSTLHSATVAAVLVGGYFGRSGLAVSQVVGGPQLWSTATRAAEPLLEWLGNAPTPTLLNLNVPNTEHGEVLGLRQAGLAGVGGVQTVIVGRDAAGIDIDLVTTTDVLPPGVDSALLREGYATVSAMAPPTALDVDLPTDNWWGSSSEGR
ncbi:MAG: 5'/3'-nucleotidase SurE [Acidimicrobiia bacterium]|nr:5'/3'-nucleotidase SurE [Actinomycetota bacterium]MBL6925367.1 5'/3'-nucleotidase SurE [Acidimicrobiia bacterium]MBL6925925.1 5'/3'-nucleotidase SurE [Acidimicrobiia bacterium]